MAAPAHLSGSANWATSFHYRDFRLLWGSTLLSSVGMGMDQVALGWLVLQMTDSPFMVGVSAAVRMAPFFFLGIISGAVADRLDRALFIRVTIFAAAIVAGLMALVLLLDAARVWHVLALAAAMGGVWAFNQTVRQAYIFDIVGPELALNGMSLSGLSQKIGQIAGALIAGVLIAVLDVGSQYLAVAAAHLLAVAVLLAIRSVAQGELTRREPVLQQVMGYFQLVRQNRTLLILMCLTAAVEVFGFTHNTLLPVFAKNVLGVGAVGLGIMTAIRQAGGILGLMVLASLGNFRRKGLLMFATATAFGLGQMAFSLTTNIIIFVSILFIVNACATTVDMLHKILMQANVPNEQRGRAMGSWVLSIGVAPVGHLGVGAMAGVLGAPGALLVNGSILAFVGIASAVGMPHMRRLE